MSGSLAEDAEQSQCWGDEKPSASNGSEGSERVSITESVDEASVPVPTTCSFYLGRSKVTHMDIQDYVNKGYLWPDTGTSFHLPGNETMPRPKPYEAMVFHDFFIAGLDFPLEGFVSEVLERF